MLSLFIHGGVQIEATVRCHFIPISMAIITKKLARSGITEEKSLRVGMQNHAWKQSAGLQKL
jgi:hypothetical protein